jgi:hypothetical protein
LILATWENVDGGGRYRILELKEKNVVRFLIDW